LERVLKTFAPERIAIKMTDKTIPLIKKNTIHEKRYDEKDAPMIF